MNEPTRHIWWNRANELEVTASELPTRTATTEGDTNRVVWETTTVVKNLTARVQELERQVEAAITTLHTLLGEAEK